MGCDNMLPPHRHCSPLEGPLVMEDLPSMHPWSGNIAYLDRDGVLNKWSENYVNSPDEVQMLPEAGKAIGTLRRSGFRICVVTNQSPIGRGLWDHQRLEKIHKTLQEQLLENDPDAELDLFYTAHMLLQSVHGPENQILGCLRPAGNLSTILIIKKKEKFSFYSVQIGLKDQMRGDPYSSETGHLILRLPTNSELGVYDVTITKELVAS